MTTVILTTEAAGQLEALVEPIHGRVLKLITRLDRWPAVSGAKPLSGNLAGHWRLRTGDYRLQFHVVGDVVVIEKIGHRRDFYGD
ncbi:MAG: type II toxin-antitoxin system RelE family toxin [Planctomycetaceae bacterium]